MAIFGRRVARQRLRDAARQSLRVPVFAARIDYSLWITGGLWPKELSTVTAQNARIADQLRVDLERITDAANAELHLIQHMARSYAERRTREDLVVSRARHLAVQRIESTVRQLSRAPLAPLAGDPSVGQSLDVTVAAVSGPGARQTAVNQDDLAPHRLTPGEVVSAAAGDDGLQSARPDTKRDEAIAVVVTLAGAVESPVPDGPFQGRSESEHDMGGRDTSVGEPIGAACAGVSAPRPNTTSPDGKVSLLTSEQDLPLDATTEPTKDATAAVEAQPRKSAIVEQAAEGRHAKPDADGAAHSLYKQPVTDRATLAWTTQFAVADANVVRQLEASVEGEAPARYLQPGDDDALADPVDEPAVVHAASPAALRRRGVHPHNSDERLRLLLTFVARQEPGLHWVIGVREDGITVLTTDIACGWIPPDITLPAGVQLLPPGRRAGSAAEIIGPTTQLEARAPSDPLDWSADLSGVESSIRPRQLPLILDLAWELREATRWRDGLPRMVNTLAVAGVAGTGVAESELGLLRVHHDTVLYQLLADYPGSDPPVLSNALLLFAAEGIASGNRLSANYHLSWFRALDASV